MSNFTETFGQMKIIIIDILFVRNVTLSLKILYLSKLGIKQPILGYYQV